MFKPLSVFIGARYMRARRRNQFVSFISLVSLFGMVLGVAVLIIVISVMNGFEAEIRGRMLDAIPHLQIKPANSDLQDVETLSARLLSPSLHTGNVLGDDMAITAVSPYVGGKGMLSVPGVVRGVLITGIDPQQEEGITRIGKHTIAGSVANLRDGEFGVVIGALLARHLGVAVGDQLSLVLPSFAITPLGVFPRQKRFTVAAVFEVGAQIDSDSAFIHVADAARLFRTGKAVHGVRARTNDLFAAPTYRERLQQRLGAEFEVSDWSQSQGGLFQAISMEKRMVGFLLLIVVAVAAFNIVSILVMMVADKRSAIAVLRTVGVSRGGITRIFITQGGLIALLGVGLGVVIGVLVALNIGAIVGGLERVLAMQIFDPDVYFISHMPSVLRLQDVLLIAIAALLMSFLATLYPAWRAASIKPAEVLRYE